MAISGKASMKPMKSPIAAPDATVMVFERAPTMAVPRAMRAAKPHPIQKMEGIKSAPYRTDNRGGIPSDAERSLPGRNPPERNLSGIPELFVQ